MQLRKKTSKESSAGKEKATTGSQTEGDLEQHERFPDIFYPPTATVCTDAFSAFLGDYHANLDFFFFVIHLVSRADEQRVRAAKALISVARSDDERTRYEKSAADDSVVLRELQKHNVVLSQTLTNGAVNSFQRYFSGIIQSAAQRRPELLSSSQTIRVDDVLRSSRHRDLVAFIINRKVTIYRTAAFQKWRGTSTTVSECKCLKIIASERCCGCLWKRATSMCTMAVS